MADEENAGGGGESYVSEADTAQDGGGSGEATQGGSATTDTTTANDSQQTTASGGTQGTATATTTPTAAVTWNMQPLPPEMAAIYPGVKTLGEFEKRFRSSSGEGRKQAARVKELETQLAARAQQAQPPAAQQQQAQQQAAASFWGFANAKEYDEAFKKNPVEHAARVEKYLQERATNAAQQHVEKLLNDRFAPYEQKERAAVFDRQKNETFTTYPELGPGQPWHEMVVNYQEANPQITEAVGTLHGKQGVNVVEIMGKLATYDLMRARLQAAEGKRVDAGKKAAPSRPGIGAKVTPKDTTLQDALRANAARDGYSSEEADAFAARADKW